jgi:hypothetical protein
MTFNARYAVFGPQITHLCGTIWALFQSDHSTIDYIDFVNYALLKWDEYKARKESFVSLKMP